MCLPRQSLRTTPHKEGEKGSSLWEHSIPLEEKCEWIEEKEQDYIGICNKNEQFLANDRKSIVIETL